MNKTVFEFALVMQEKLDDNADKGGWEDTSFGYLLERLEEEIEELKNAIKEKSSAFDISRECADVANFAMMISDNITREEVKAEQARRREADDMLGRIRQLLEGGK